MTNPVLSLEFPGLPGDISTFWRHYLALPREGLVPTLRAFLDNAPYRLMPRVAIADMIAPDDFVVRFYGTGLAESSGADWTGISAKESASRGLPMQTSGRGWTAVNHPCGHLSSRMLLRRERSFGPEMTFEVMIVALPLARPGEADQCMMTFNSVPTIAPVQSAAAAETVGHAIRPLRWIDIGAGVPQD